MADAQIRAVITAKDEASSVVSSFGNAISKAVVPVGLMTGALVGFGAMAVKAFAGAESANAMLQHAVVDVTKATQEQFIATSKLADELERKGVLDGDNIKQGLAQLSTFGLSNKAVRDLGGSLADLAVNQFGVKASGEQLATSANMIAKALNGQFGILEKSGIRFTEAQKAMIKYGTETEKVTAINQGFQQNLKFTNDVAKYTTEGGLAALEVAMGNINETIGGVIANALEPLIAKVSEVAKRIKEFADKNPEVIRTIVMVGIAVAGLGAAFVALAAVGMVVNAVFSPFVLIAFLIIAAVALIAYGVNEMAKAFGGWGKVLEALQPTIQFFKDLWQTVIDLFNEYLLPVLQALWAIFVEQILPALKEFWEKNKDWIIPTLKLIAVIIGAVVLVALGLLVAGIAFVVAAIYALVKIITFVIDMFRWFDKTTKELATNLWNGVVNAFNDFNRNLYNWARDTVNGVVDFFVKLPGRISGAIGNAGNAVGRALGIPGFATGVTNFGGGLALVGEQGPEVVALPRGANVIPNDQLGSMGGSGSGSTINITVQAGAFMGSQQDARQYAMVIADALKDIANSRAMTVGELLV